MLQIRHRDLQRTHVRRVRPDLPRRLLRQSKGREEVRKRLHGQRQVLGPERFWTSGQVRERCERGLHARTAGEALGLR